ncbi:g11771 [Coccomyxa elongata]
MIDFLFPLGVAATPTSIKNGFALCYIKWPDIGAGVQWHVNGCQDQPQMPVDQAFGEKIEAFKIACEMLETQFNTQPACVYTEFCKRVFVPPHNNSYVVKLVMNNHPLRKNNSASRPAGIKTKPGRVGELLENGEKKNNKKVAK